MTMDERPTICNATHVAFDTPTAEQLLRMGATSVVPASDCLVIGPSRQDAEEHTRARKTFWDSFDEFDRLYSSKICWKPPIVLWVSSSVHERVNLWRSCSWLRQVGISCDDVAVVDFESVVTSRRRDELAPMYECTDSVSDHPDVILLERLDKAQPWPRERYDRAVQLWVMYADANPLLFVESCIRGVEGFPELASLWALLSCFHTRRAPDGRLLLSRFDEFLLELLSEEWRTPLAVYCHKSRQGAELRGLLSYTGDLFLVDRLTHWADHDASAFVERAPGPNPEEPMKSFVYRITERGLRLRDKGLDQLTDAPSLPLAGIEAYSASAPWVLLEDGRLARM
ncbi:hypothetical protein BE17_31965 [Sorangium cellulosum]|uniref:Uncharacterized protein n=1 Tax=Sorangium cellulosum TaxID=56 RepID=A0A150QZ53_SORCE|nr:hypothetical protein BE17_31965 [Sorangium cellulosum]